MVEIELEPEESVECKALAKILLNEEKGSKHTVLSYMVGEYNEDDLSTAEFLHSNGVLDALKTDDEELVSAMSSHVQPCHVFSVNPDMSNPAQFLQLWKELDLSIQVNTSRLVVIVVFVASLCPTDDYAAKDFRGRLYATQERTVSTCKEILQLEYPQIMPHGEFGFNTISTAQLKSAMDTDLKKTNFHNVFGITVDAYISFTKRQDKRGCVCIMKRICDKLGIPVGGKRGVWWIDQEKWLKKLKLCVFWQNKFRAVLETSGIEAPEI